jgi:hypothetical protein
MFPKYQKGKVRRLVAAEVASPKLDKQMAYMITENN